MSEPPDLISTVYAGWQNYQSLLIRALAPLTPEQLELRASPGHRSVNEIARHIVGARGRWFHGLLGVGGDVLAELGNWDRRGMPSRSAQELARGLDETWSRMQQAIAHFTPADWEQSWPGDDPGDPPRITPQWVIWHLIEHDLHHGGEISLTLGLHGLEAPAL